MNTTPADLAARIAELEAILFTVDGKGKEAKREAFYELMKAHIKARASQLQWERKLVAHARIIERIREEARSWYGIDMTFEQVNGFFSGETEALNEIATNGMDTCSREMCAEILGRKLVGRSWPCGGDPDEVSQQFFADLKAALDQRGIKHTLE
jgi:hypothetical protein